MFKRLAVLSIIIVLLISLTIFFGGSILAGRSGDRILPGVTSAGLPLGGLTPEQADKLLRETLAPSEGLEIVLVAEDRQWIIPLKSVGAIYDYPEAVANAYAVGRSGSLMRRVSELLGNKIDSTDIKLPLKFDSELLKRELERINGEYSIKPLNARLLLDKNQVSVVPGKEGVEMDLAEITGHIYGFSAGMELKLAITPKTVTPEIREQDLSGLTDILGECTTLFEAGSVGRVNNIVRASGKLDGKLVKPGEVFAFNGVVGTIDEKNGYFKAKVIADGQLVDDYGGGVCQVSTTLYGAVLLSGFEIIERYPHSMPVKYVPPGLDVTVAEDQKDFRFKNNLNRPVYIISSTEPDQGHVKVVIVGKKQNNLIFKIDSVVKTTSPGIVIKGNNSLRRGQSVVVSEGSPGFEASVYRYSLAEDGVEKKELVSHDIYLPTPKIVEVGI